MHDRTSDDTPSSLRSSILRISDEKTLQLVLECEKEECLWNTNLVDYPNKDERMMAYKVVADKLDIPNFTAHHVMVKFKNLRNSYCQELKKIAADAKYKPKVFWFAHMDKFLRPHLQKIKSYMERTKLLQEPRIDEKKYVDSDDQIETTDWVIEHSIQSDASSSNRSSTYRNEAWERLASETKKRKHSTESNDDEQRVKKSEYDYSDVEVNSNQSLEADPLTGITTTILQIDETPTTTASTTGHTKFREVDHYEAFGTYVASLLKSLPPKKALLLEPKIIKMIVSVGVEDLSDDDFES